MLKRLVFHCFWENESGENLANIAHFKCLKHYSSIFDEVVFVISVNDLNNAEVIKDAMSRAMDIFYKNPSLTFKVIKNDGMRECQTFKSEIVDKMETIDGLTFFAHNKGTTNVEDETKNKYSILDWIYGMYFLNLEFVDETERILLSNTVSSIYGSFLEKSIHIKSKYNTWYAGTFYWLNTQKISFNKKQYPKYFDRTYAEMFAGNICDYKIGEVSSHNWVVLDMGIDYYQNAYDAIKECCAYGDDLQRFIDFKQMINDDI